MHEPQNGTLSGNCLISVIVPTFNRRDLLARLLESLWRQTLPHSAFEVVIVNDGSTDGTGRVTSEFARRAWCLKVIDRENGGPAAARNAGAQAAEGEYLAFTDDDCVATPEWLEKIIQGFRSTGAVALQGRTSTLRELRTPLTHEIEVLTAWTSALQTCNAAYLQTAFYQAGGFDESFPHPHNEDVELAWRVEELGPIVFADEVHVIHPPRPDRFLKVVRSVKMLESDFDLYSKHPAKYQRYVGRSPWWTIYWTVFVVQQLRLARSCFRYVFRTFRPRYFLEGLAVLVGRWFSLIWYLPLFVRADGLCRRKNDMVQYASKSTLAATVAGKRGSPSETPFRKEISKP